MRDVVITVYLNATLDPQRGTRLPASVEPLQALIDSVASHGRHLTVLTDCLSPSLNTPAVTFLPVEPDPVTNVYLRRWRLIADHIEAHPDIERVWCVDGTDVEMLHDPFDEMVDGCFYIGSENNHVGCDWMRVHHPALADWCRANSNRTLLNPGVLGGGRDDVQAFAERIAAHWPTTDNCDMAIINKVAYEAFPWFTTGGQVHTPYKQHRSDTRSWFKHK